MFAGVQFPLADAGDLEKELGTRHRAAVGLSQEYDAVVLVVSEETGDVSIAEKGALFRKLNPEGLRGLLTELLVGGKPREKTKE
jgi:diadenylate cyclase